MPQRFLRPGITNSDRWNQVSFEAQSLYVRLMTRVDDFGRFDGRPAVICGECFSVWNNHHPEDVVNPQRTAALCQQLADKKLLEFYEAEGKKVVQVTQWQERTRAAKSKWPEPDSKAQRNDNKPQETAAESCLPRPSSLDQTSIDQPPGDAREMEVELPAGFPKTEKEAKAHAGFVGCTEEFAAKVWQRAMSRGGHDSKDVPVRNFRAHLAIAWSYEREHMAKKPKESQTPAGKPPGWEPWHDSL